MWWIGQQLDRGDAELLEVLERRLGREAGVRAAQVLAHVRVQLREALHVHLVDDRLVPRLIRAAGRPPSRSCGSTTTHFGIASASSSSSSSRSASSSALGTYGSTFAASQSTGPSIAFAYGSIRSLFGLKRCPLAGSYGAVDAVAVALARARRRGCSSAS